MGKNLFNSVMVKNPGYNVFDLTHDVKTTCGMGMLVPIMCTEAVPGDKFKIGAESLVRFQPMVAPVMHRFDITMHYFFVPTRILWPNFEKWITNTPTPSVLPDFPTVQITEGNWDRLADYLGLPQPAAAGSYDVSAVPFAAYQAIFNEYYRDQNLITPIDYELIDGDNSANAALKMLRYRAWEHDYFTSALPFAQKGAAVDIPLGQVELNENSSQSGRFVRALDHDYSDVGDVVTSGVEPNANITIDGIQQVYDPKDTLVVGSTSINDLRRAFRLQEWLEKMARGGSRYIETILMHFGVKSPDARLQRPEYITGVKSPIVISEVLNTTGTTDAPQGTMAGHGISVNGGKYGSYYVYEHGYIMGIASVMPKTAYQQGIPKHFLKTQDPIELFWDSFAHLGEQPVLNKELYQQHTDPNGTFGYVPRYAEYKFENNKVSGQMRQSLDFWHAGRIFQVEPNLNEAFIQCTPDQMDRIFAVGGGDAIIMHVLNRVTAARKMPKYGTPTY